MPTRRDVLRGMAVVGAASLTRCGPSLSTEPLSDEPSQFPLGVGCGDVTDASALLWSHYRGERELTAEVWLEGPEGTKEIVALRNLAASPAGVVRLEVEGLAPGLRYQYAFFEAGDPLGARSRTGRFKTAFGLDDLLPLSVGATCCTRQGYSLATLERAAEKTDLDLFLLLGDTAYVDGQSSLEGYRREWQAALEAPGHRALRSAHSLLATWDDHEFQNDWSGATIRPERFNAAADAFFEHQPVRRSAEHPRRIWRSVRWGRTAEFFVLDSRGERNHVRGEYMSPEQLRWLKEGLAKSSAVFKVILNSVPIAELPGALWGFFGHDRWEGYPEQRTEILKHVEDKNIGGVLWVAGDFHLASMGRVSRKGVGSKAIEVLVGPGANAANPSPSYPGLPQCDWASGISNYAVLDFDPTTRQVALTYRDGSDRILQQRTYTL